MLFSLPSTVQSSRFFWAGPKYNTGWTDCSEVWAGSPNGGVGQGSSVKRFMLLPILEYILGYMHTSHFQLKHVFLANSVYFRNGLDNTKTYFKTTIVDTLSLLHLIGLVFTGKQHWLSSYIFVLFFSYRLVVHIEVAWHPAQVVRALDLEVFSALLTMYGKPFFHLADVVTAIRSERAIFPSFIHWL